MIKKGKLITWKDERGFGFIKSNDGDLNIFLHISEIKRASRRPKVGDIILYDILTQKDGKVRATNASIQGVKLLPLSKDSSLQNPGLIITVIGMIIMSFIVFLEMFITTFFKTEVVSRANESITKPDISDRATSSIESITKPRCIIKGNISYNNGIKYYHLPGMEDYQNTVIHPNKGEKWFCTESEAIENGWQKAPI